MFVFVFEKLLKLSQAQVFLDSTARLNSGSKHLYRTLQKIRRLNIHPHCDALFTSL